MPKVFYGGAAIIFSLFGIGYEFFHTNKEKAHTIAEPIRDALPPPKLTKKDAKVIIQQAMELESQGENAQALELYNKAYRVYRRAIKASNRKLTFLRQRIAILTSYEGKTKRALLGMMESYTGAAVGILTEELHFELYYDLCLMYYKFGQFDCCIKMLGNCMEVAEAFHEKEKEILTGIHQFLGFSYMRRGKIREGEKHLTKALDYLNTIKMDNKAFLYYSCQEFCDFYTSIGDYKKALLFLEQSRIVLNQKDFFSKENIEKGMDLHSPYIKKFIQDLRLETQNKKIDHKASVLRSRLGDYKQFNQKKNLPLNKLSKEEKNSQVHSLLRW